MVGTSDFARLQRTVEAGDFAVWVSLLSAPCCRGEIIVLSAKLAVDESCPADIPREFLANGRQRTEYAIVHVAVPVCFLTVLFDAGWNVMSSGNLRQPLSSASHGH